MKVSIVGTGYVGLITGVCLAEKGHQVICVDVDKEKVNKINNGIAPIFERGLEELLQKNIKKNLQVTTDLYNAVLETDITLIAVGTPYNGTEIDLTHVNEVSRQIGNALKDKANYHVVVVKSTIVPGTTDEVVLSILEEVSKKKVGVDFGVGVNPEFLTEGDAVNDFMHPDRIVLGGLDGKTIQALEELYHCFEGVDFIRTNNKTAEMIKYASNALLATMISFSNELGNLCSALGNVDIVDVMKGVHMSNYLSPIQPNGNRVVAPITAFLMAGCGFGGSCLPKDVKALISHGKKASKQMPLLEAVIQVNEHQYEQVLYLLNRHFPSLKGIHVTILGLSFKPGTDDMRESPAIPIIRKLLDQGTLIKAYDPIAKHEAQKIFSNSIDVCDDLFKSMQNSHAVILVTKWEEFYKVPELLVNIQPQPLFIDGRRMLDKHSIVNYQGIGL